MRYLLSVFIYFFYIFTIEPIFLPFRLRTLFSLLGFYMLIKEKNISFRYILCNKKWKALIASLTLLLVVAIMSTLVNGYFDPHFYKYPIQIFISLCSAYFYLYLLSRVNNNCCLSEKQLMFFFVAACVVQSVTAVMFFLHQQTRDVALSLIKVSELSAEAIEGNGNLDVRRLIGFGAAWFSAGTVFSIAILNAFILINKANSITNLIKLFFSAVFILVVGSMIARTTFVGAALAIFYILFTKGDLKNKIVVFQIMAVLTVLLFFIYVTYLENDPVFELAFQRAFSLFYDYQSTGELSGLSEYMEKLYPDNIETWIIGDGKMADPKNPETAYYMNVDIGVSRVIFGIGVTGLIIYSLVQLCICRLTNLGGLEVITLFLAYIAFMNKGLFSYDLILSPFIMLHVFNHVNNRKNKRLVNNNANDN